MNEPYPQSSDYTKTNLIYYIDDNDKEKRQPFIQSLSLYSLIDSYECFIDT